MLVDFAEGVLVFTELVLDVFELVVEEAAFVDEGACQPTLSVAPGVCAMHEHSRQQRKSVGFKVMSKTVVPRGKECVLLLVHSWSSRQAISQARLGNMTLSIKQLLGSETNLRAV